jgi:hypothetical protein
MTKSNYGTFRTKQIPFTQVPNTIIRDKNVSLKAKGLYQLIQSYITIPNFTLTKSYLMKQCVEGEDAFTTAWQELKKAGYLKQYKQKNIEGIFIYEYDLLDIASIDVKEQTSDNEPQPDFGGVEPDPENPPLVNPDLVNQYDNNTGFSYTDVNNTILSYQSNNIDIFEEDKIGRDMISEEEKQQNIETLTENINPNLLIEMYPNKKEEITEIFNLMCESVNSNKEYITISGERKTIREIQNCFFKLQDKHIEYILDCLDKTTTKIKNPKAYLLATIYNSYYTYINSQNLAFNHEFKDDTYMNSIRFGI